MIKLFQAATSIAILLTGAPALAEWTANIGWTSEYFYRGVFQKASSASGGIDYQHGGFSAGTWAADVGDGLEVDGFVDYSGSAGDFSYGIGFTGYYYTSDFDDTYEELNLNVGYRFVTIDYAAGRFRNFSGPDKNYGYYAVSLEHSGFHGRLAGFSNDFDGRYLEIGYGQQVSNFDVDLTLIINDEHLNTGSDTDGDETLVFTIARSFDIR
ncbi:MAG: TorF family putative porin [Gammaproteobacteria bacterium]|nr:TorF family putative porin [Gammaproteobacteria bacterium]